MNYKESSIDNFPQLKFLDKYMAFHKGFIAGGCFKNILSGERVKDIDIFFENGSDFQEAVNYFNEQEEWSLKYRNEKVCAFKKEGEKTWVELVESEFGSPEKILRSFDFTVTKMAYVKKPIVDNNDKIQGYEYSLIFHEDFFEHLYLKRLVIDENIPFPISTWERTYRYKGYGFNMCRETKKKLLSAISKTDLDSENLSLYDNGGWD